MLARLHHLIACFAGCVIASLFGLLLMLKFDAPILGMLCAALFPALACRLSGVCDRKQLVKIAFYAGGGWMLMFMLQPVVSQSAASHAERIVALPLMGNDWHIPTSIVSTLLALVGVCFIPAQAMQSNRLFSDGDGNDS